MPRIPFAAVIDAPIEKVWAFYNDIRTLPRITPPPTRITLPSTLPVMREGAVFRLQVLQPPVPFLITWETIIREYRPPYQFVDIQGKSGPFAFWQHEHIFEPLDDGRTRLTDIVTYDPPLGLLGLFANGLFIDRQLRAMFDYRHRKTQEAMREEFDTAG